MVGYRGQRQLVTGAGGADSLDDAVSRDIGNYLY